MGVGGRGRHWPAAPPDSRLFGTLGGGSPHLVRPAGGTDGALPPNPSMDSPSLAVIGLVCDVVGVFFLANSIRFREPRKAIEENLGVAAKSLDRVRDTALNNMQV